jgi:hypothetical protein
MKTPENKVRTSKTAAKGNASRLSVALILGEARDMKTLAV